MDFRRLVFSLTIIAVFAMAVRVSIDSDTWWHLRAGAWIVEHQAVLRQDLFSLTRMGDPWIYPGWLAQALLYAAFSALGYAGLNLLTALLVTAGLISLWFCMRSPLLLRSAVLLLAAAASAVYWSARPQIFSFALSGLFILLLERSRQKRKLLWLLPLLMVLWVNLHGGFMIGLLLLAAHLGGAILAFGGGWLLRKASLGELWRQQGGWITALGLAAAGCLAALVVNPHGAQMALYPFKTIALGVLQDYIAEWQAPDLASKEVQPFLWMLGLALGSMLVQWRKVRASDLLLIIGFGWMSFSAARNIATFALAAAPILDRQLSSIIGPWLEKRRRATDLPPRLTRPINATLVLLALIAAGIKISIPLQTAVNEAQVARQQPVGPVATIAALEPPGNLFNSYNWGGYITWALYPAYPSFVDGRTDLFGDELLRTYLDVWLAAEGWQQSLESWNINLALIEKDAPLVAALEDLGWKRLDEDDKAVLLAR